jgi:hypothetical protein
VVDDDLPNTLKGAQRLADEYSALRCKVGVIYGERSELFRNARSSTCAN